MALPSEQTLHDIAAEIGTPWGIFPLRVKTTLAGAKSRVTVVVDSEKEPDIEAVGEFSTALSQEFDAREERGELDFGAGYNLEVTTPGIDEPLVKPYQWARNQGRRAAITLTDGTTETVRIGSMSPDGERLAVVYSQGPKGNKKAAKKIVNLRDIARAVVEIEFNGAPKNEAALSAEPFEE